MLDLIKFKIANFIVKNKANQHNIEKKSFKSLLKNSFRFLILNLNSKNFDT